ncbi:type II secretion system F family protein [Candidatus Gottesmanbacteria bacterium]|nr:type II secretion system F family protein [Candidatus Gottesmanbacteria bacterium]
MPQFTYKALDQYKRIQEGRLSAKTKFEIAQLLGKQNLTPVSIKQLPENSANRRTLPAIEKITFCRYLSTMLASGLSLTEGLNVLREESKHPVLRSVLADMSYSLEQGQELSTVFERYPNIFEPYFLTLTKAGEVSGKLADVFKYLESELRSEYSLIAKIKGALLYPIIVFSAMIGIGVLVFFFVLPQIAKVFLKLKLNLPFYTSFLFNASIKLQGFFWHFMIAGAATLIGGYFAFKKPKVRMLLFYLIQPIPLIRELIKRVDMARFNRIFSTLLKSAVPITDALEISLKSLSWYEYKNLSSVLAEEIKKGKSFESVIRNRKIFPTLMVQMVAAGEKTGTLDETLSDLASFYEEEVEEELKNVTAVIEPVMMLLVGIAVCGLILSIIAPIYSVIGSLQQATQGSVSPR